ncbi:hypothetical protein HRR83_001654 [Exophiala dermatitidis]|uniref:NAD(P)-binding protein n=2 Tax=Exophiala dermatitidis TaxID=5970 RepID=H6C5T1_EXODN|nr:uncharacterized protein HMPREF1120_07076 [Exophiala dermatitidis NIH/UT8656]KAJ4516325.1 hypothetical protein HRR73_004788 [Exophiala dermatitidis]EHY59077.1 hypothetical protein HMPREF1120_07076 [Exophiala dermatitidis NIH/UT8656]KAJ4526460.1 hypothetical protein HRR74_001658 [Exophiala dermatitidis]KAJ4532294.1 hypothetical protein HRR76_007292 [Exophiala dermatitidis]KAJ4546331.1 hypothetical protein HRR77_004866 [Exophiala dermatitidis]
MQSALHAVVGPKKELHDLSGRTAIVTGGANGIGFQISRQFAQAKAKVIMVNRKEEQGDEAIKQIKAETPDADVDWVGCDLGSLKEVKEVFTDLREKLERLDLLILSAGINTDKFDLDADGIDRHFGVNYLGQFYAVNLLYPLIRKTSKLPNTPAPRIVFEASEVHRAAPSDIHFGSLEEINNKDFGATHLYARSKLALILLAKYLLPEKVFKKNGDRVYSLSVHPGTVNTQMQQTWKSAYPGIFGNMLSWAMQAVGRDVEQGSYSALWAATSSEIEEKDLQGYYFVDPGQPGKETSQASDPALAEALWNLSIKLIKEKVGEDALVPWDQEAS